jgi:hypothetical protein
MQSQQEQQIANQGFQLAATPLEHSPVTASQCETVQNTILPIRSGGAENNNQQHNVFKFETNTNQGRTETEPV